MMNTNGKCEKEDYLVKLNRIMNTLIKFCTEYEEIIDKNKDYEEAMNFVFGIVQNEIDEINFLRCF